LRVNQEYCFAIFPNHKEILLCEAQ
jgi:hypothetical protein